jgi:hypothetical protein
MHPFKIRIWDTHNKIMFYPKRPIQPNFDVSYSDDQLSLSFSSWQQEYKSTHSSDTSYILMPSTGLFSKDNVEIYLGDILQCPWDFDTSQFLTGEVVFYKGSFYLSKGPELEAPELNPYDLYSFNDTPSRLYNWDKSTIIGHKYDK